MKYKCLSIAGSDGSGGAGIQADLKTFSALGCYGMNVITAIAVQNTCGVKNCYDLPLTCIEEQLHVIFDDIRPDAIKIGMLFSEKIITLVAHFLKNHAKNIPMVLDPVMIAKSGDALLLPEAINSLKTKLIPLVTLITPNLPEAHTLIPNIIETEALTKALLDLGPQAVLLKGGHAAGTTATDILLDHHQSHSFTLPRIESKNTHGTGCTLSAAITSFLARGDTLPIACEKAKHYLHGAMLATQHQSVGRGHGPVDHFYAFKNKI